MQVLLDFLLLVAVEAGGLVRTTIVICVFLSRPLAAEQYINYTLVRGASEPGLHRMVDEILSPGGR